jgi:protein-disulfide isomerase
MLALIPLPTMRILLTLAFLLMPSIALGASLSSSAASSASAVTIRSGEHVRGSASAPVTIVEYGDFQCPYCKQQYEVFMKIVRKYRRQVSWIYRHYPLDFHPHAQAAAEASECVAYLGGNAAFWGFADTLMGLESFKPSDFPAIAKRFGVDEKIFNRCMEKHVFAQKVKEQLISGQNAGVEGTPTVFIVSRKGRYQETVAGADEMEAYTRIIDDMLRELREGNPGGFKPIAPGPVR